MKYRKFIASSTMVAAVVPVLASEPEGGIAAAPPQPGRFDPWTGEGFVIANADQSIRLTPYINISAVLGESSADHPGDLFVGEHDPDETGLDLQSIELAAGVELGETLGGRINYRGFLDQEDQLDGEVEELLGSLHSPERDLELRFGRYLNRFGFLNETHAHAWNFIDTPLAVGRILGPHGLRAEGAEFNYAFGPRQSRSLFSVSLGQMVGHDHDHGHGEDEEHDEEHEHEEDHDHGEEHDEHDHAGEDFAFDDTFMTLRLKTTWIANDFHRWTPIASLAFGENASGGNTQILGLGLTWNWFENGYEPGGARLTWATEGFVRNLESGSDHGHDHDHDEHDEPEHEEHGHEEEEHEDHHHEDAGSVDDHEFGFYSQLLYAPNPRLEFGGRVGYVSGSGDAGLEERWRLSPVGTVWLNPGRSVSLRAQYNFDILEETEEHGIWLQLSVSWGGHVH